MRVLETTSCTYQYNLLVGTNNTLLKQLSPTWYNCCRLRTKENTFQLAEFLSDRTVLKVVIPALKHLSEFYREFNAKVNKAEALQRAQLAVFAKQKSPYFWAPFVLVGNWL